MNQTPRIVVTVDQDGNRTVVELPARPPYMTSSENSGEE